MYSPISRDIFLHFELHHCRGWQSPDDLLETIKLAINLARLIPLENSYVENPRPQPGGVVLAQPVVKDLKAWFKQNYYVQEKWDTEKFFVTKSKEDIRVFLRTTLEEAWTIEEPIWQNTVDIQVSAQSFGEAYNIVVFSCTLFGKSLTNPESEWHRLPDLMAVYQKFAQPVVERLRPEYALITEGFPRETYGRDVLNAKLKFIHWCNYFGTTYLEKYGEELFLSAPGWRVERLGDGVWYQLTEHFTDPKEESFREQVFEHFKSTGAEGVVPDVRHFSGLFPDFD